MDSEQVSGDVLQDGQACNQWLELMRNLRPYHGFYAGKTAHRAVESVDSDIMGLRDTVAHFSDQLTDGQLPERFRNGVKYIIDNDVVKICRHFGIRLTCP
jgi:hypothetical protein